MRNLLIALGCIAALAVWMWIRNAELRAELHRLRDQHSTMIIGSGGTSIAPDSRSVSRASPPPISVIEAGMSDLGKYAWGNNTKYALLGSEIFRLKQGQLPEALQILTEGSANANTMLDTRTSLVQALFEHWSSLNLQEAKAEADALDGDSRTKALRGILMHLLDVDPDAAVELASNHSINDRTVGASEDMLLGPIITSMAKRDPQEAVSFVSRLDSSEEKTSHWFTVARIWAESDPLAAFRWGRESLHGEYEGALTSMVFSNWAKRDLASALRSSLAIEESNAQGHALAAVIAEWSLEDENAALAYLANDVPEAVRTTTLMERIGASLGHAKVDSILGAADRMEDLELREVFLYQAAERRVDHDDNALRLARHLKEGSRKDQLFARLVTNLVQFDSRSASDWLGSIEPSSSRDAAVQVLADHLAASDLRTAIGWATTISDAERRVRSIEDLARVWLDKDRASASQWIENSEAIPDRVRDRMLQ